LRDSEVDKRVEFQHLKVIAHQDGSYLGPMLEFVISIVKIRSFSLHLLLLGSYAFRYVCSKREYGGEVRPIIRHKGYICTTFLTSELDEGN
jgi:hypothetical protein